MNQEQNEIYKSNMEIIKRLNVIITVMFSGLDMKNLTQLKKIKILSSLSFTNDEMALILRAPKTSIAAQKYKKSKKKKIKHRMDSLIPDERI